MIVLGIVITAATVVIGMQAFAEGQKKANADAMVDDAFEIASKVQAWRLRPASFGGGQGASLAGFSMDTLGYTTDEEGQYDTGNASFEAYTSGGTRVVVLGDNVDTDTRVVIVVNGHGPVCLSTRITHTNDNEATQASQHASCENL